ncbi:hypothetical protein Tco_0757455 [Tanacetum coccineum]
MDVAVQLKYGQNSIKSPTTANTNNSLDSIDDGKKKIIKEQDPKRKSPKLFQKSKKLETDQLDLEVLVRSSKKPTQSHAVKTAKSFRNLEQKKILLDKMEANNSITSMVQKMMQDKNPPPGTDRGPKEKVQEEEPASTRAPSERQPRRAGILTDQEFEIGVQDEQAEEESNGHDNKASLLDTVRRDDMSLQVQRRATFHRLRNQVIESYAASSLQEK